MMLFSFLNKLDTKIDYIGQELSLKLMYLSLLIGYAFSLLAGIVMNNLMYTLVFGIVTAALSFLATVPSWGYFRRNPLKFKKESKIKNN